MSDSYDAAQTALNSQKAQLLAAMAAQGSQGRALYDQSQADLASQRSNAVNAALADAQRRGAPQAMQDLVSSEVGAPYARRAMDIDSSHQAQDQWLQNLTSANSSYFDQSAGAIPTLRAQAERAAAVTAAKDAKSAATHSPLNVLKSEFGGSLANLNKYVLDQSDSFVHQARTAAGVDPKDEAASQKAHDAFDAQLGLPPGYSYGLSRERSTAKTDTFGKKAGLSDGAVHQIRSSAHYAKAQTVAQRSIGTTKAGGTYSNGKPKPDVAFSLKDLAGVLAHQFPGSPGLQRLIIEEYRARF